MEKPLFPACYLPPISYFAAICQWEKTGIRIEQHEHFPKQTYRNRASIYGANGQLDLIIPVKKNRRGEGLHTPMKDVRISYESDWQRLHWLSLQTAYRSSAYFEFYEDEFAKFYEREYPMLLTFNGKLTELILDLLGIRTSLEWTESYQREVPTGLDFRDRMNPKKPMFGGGNNAEGSGSGSGNADGDSDGEKLLIPKAASGYHQVFGDRHGFLANLSIVDLLFNHGPQSPEYLRPRA